jgi:hypothetical protein
VVNSAHDVTANRRLACQRWRSLQAQMAKVRTIAVSSVQTPARLSLPTVQAVAAAGGNSLEKKIQAGQGAKREELMWRQLRGPDQGVTGENQRAGQHGRGGSGRPGETAKDSPYTRLAAWLQGSRASRCVRRARSGPAAKRGSTGIDTAAHAYAGRRAHLSPGG